MESCRLLICKTRKGVSMLPVIKAFSSMENGLLWLQEIITNPASKMIEVIKFFICLKILIDASYTKFLNFTLNFHQ
jgi:hypothetical protein